MRINTKVITALNPCRARLDNWMDHYSDFNGDVSKFFKLPRISHADKIWVGLQLIDKDAAIIFAIDCAFTASNIASEITAARAYASYYAKTAISEATNAIDTIDTGSFNSVYQAATYSAYASHAFYNSYSAYAAERKRQLESLLYLIKGETK